MPIFSPDTFERVSDIKSLWQILSGYWSIFDYDILKRVLRFAKCKEAQRIFNNFLLKIDPALIDDVDLVMYYKVSEISGFTKPVLRVKLKADICNLRHKEIVNKVLSVKFNLEEYALRIKCIKDGCVELMYEISPELKSYLLSCKVMASDVQNLIDCGIICLKIDNMEIDLISVINIKVSL